MNDTWTPNLPDPPDGGLVGETAAWLVALKLALQQSKSAALLADLDWDVADVVDVVVVFLPPPSGSATPLLAEISRLTARVAELEAARTTP